MKKIASTFQDAIKVVNFCFLMPSLEVMHLDAIYNSYLNGGLVTVPKNLDFCCIIISDGNTKK